MVRFSLVLDTNIVVYTHHYTYMYVKFITMEMGSVGLAKSYIQDSHKAKVLPT